jgi:hypothetical protein
VFVADGSWSAADDGLRDQLALARGYLAHVPDASFEVVVFRRQAERLFGRFQSAARFDELATALPEHRRRLGNGSNLEQGVALAANLLADVRGPTRVVVITDGMTRAAFTPELAIAALAPLPRGSVVHVALRDSRYGGMSESRDDDHALSPIAAAFGGVVLAIGGDSSDAAGVAETMLGLVRPIRIDQLTIDAGGVEALESARQDAMNEDFLPEGTGERYMLLLPDAPKQLRVSGKIWGRHWSRTIDVSRSFDDAVPAMVFGHSMYAELDDAEVLAAANSAGAVSPRTSYLEAEQRLVPIPEDLMDLGGMGAIGYGVCGCGGFSTVSSCGGIGIGTGYGTYEPRPTPEELLQAWMAPRAQMCARAAGVEHIDASLFVEATRDEVVGVRVDGELAGELRTCIAEAAWDLRLSVEFTRPQAEYATALRVDAAAH